MAEIRGLVGRRPSQESIVRITCPPYDVIKPGSDLDRVLKSEEDSLYHITLGEEPEKALQKLIKSGHLLEDQEPAFYVYEQQFGDNVRTGVLTATRVTDYASGDIIRHEKTFDDKVQGRLALRAKTSLTFEPVFLLTKSPLNQVLNEIKQNNEPEYSFVSDFQGVSELHAIRNKIFRVREESKEGQQLIEMVAANPLYIADGHHRYHASLLNRQTHCLAYICEVESARIQAYNRVIRGPLEFSAVKDKLDLKRVLDFSTPPKHHFSIYSKNDSYILAAQEVPLDVVGRLDCSILEKELYPLLGLSHDMIKDQRYFDYYAESELEKMKLRIDDGDYDIAVALHPVSGEELLAVADAGIENSGIVMPEKSTFFAPKILSGIFIYKHCREC